MQCRYCFTGISPNQIGILCVVCRQFYRRDRLWRVHAVFLSDNGIAPLSIAVRLNKSAHTEIIPLLIGCNRLSAQEWAGYVVEYRNNTGDDDDGGS